MSTATAYGEITHTPMALVFIYFMHIHDKIYWFTLYENKKMLCTIYVVWSKHSRVVIVRELSSFESDAGRTMKDNKKKTHRSKAICDLWIVRCHAIYMCITWKINCGTNTQLKTWCRTARVFSSTIMLNRVKYDLLSIIIIMYRFL